MGVTKNTEAMTATQPARSELQVIPMNFSQAIPRYHHEVYKELFQRFRIHTLRFSPVLPLDKPMGRMGKRAFDLVISMLAVVLVLSWLLPIIALIIKLDSRGPVFFLQKRSGRNGQLFTCLKFRTMVVNSEADMLPAGKNDKRITRAGKFLRNHYLDELPQFFNVLLGDMSLIGPRPHMISDDLRYKDAIEFYGRRRLVKPGITGLAQVLDLTGPLDNLQQMKDRVLLDLFYVRHWSLMLDLKILWHTFIKIFHS